MAPSQSRRIDCPRMELMQPQRDEALERREQAALGAERGRRSRDSLRCSFRLRLSRMSGVVRRV
jgi:hypothetical protein